MLLKVSLKLSVILILVSCVIGNTQSPVLIDKRIQKSPIKIDKKDRIDMAIAQEYEMTKDPSMNEVPRYKLEDARKIADQKREFAIENSNSQGGILGIQWEERGPNNIAGRTRAILIDAADTSGNTIIVGSVAGGLWKTSSANLNNPNWIKIDDFLENLAVSAIAQDPSNSDIMYFSTGEGYYNIDAVQGNGIYKSTDHGNNWTKLSSTDNNAFYYTQSLKLNDQGHIFAATYSDGVYRSTDGGNSFSKILGASLWASNNAAMDIEIAADGNIFASLGLYQSDGIYKSPDNGDSWMKLSNGLPNNDLGRIEMACAQSNSDYVYAMINSLSTNNCLGIYRSSNGGDNWIEIDNPTMYGNQNFLREQGWYNMTIAVDPNNESTLYIGGIDVFKSDNAGLSFEQVTQWYGAQGMSEIHADQHNISFKNSDIIYFGNDGGIFRTENATSSNIDFTNINLGYNVTQLYSADFHPDAGSNYISAGAQDNGTQLFSEAGLNSTVELTGGDGGITHFDQTDGDLIITSYVYNNFRVSNDMGNDFTYRSFGNSGRFINPNDYDDIENIIYSAHNEGAYLRWNNPAEMGDSIDIVNVDLLSNELISFVYISPNESNTIYLGTGNGLLLKVQDAHQGVTKSATQLFDGPGYLSSISIEKNNESHLLCTFSNYGVTSIYESLNGGNNWESVEGDLPDMPVRSIVFNPHNSDQALIATDIGIWSTNDLDQESTIWEPSNGGLANVRTDMVKIRESDKMMLAATHGRGLFTSDFFAVPVINFELDSLNKYETVASQTTDACPRDYTVIQIPVFISSAPENGGFVSLNILETNATINEDFIVVLDSVYLDETNMSGFFELRYFDDAMLENDEYIVAEIQSTVLDLGVANQIYINLYDNDASPFNMPESSQITIGTGNNAESNTPFKSYYEDEKSQYIFTANELLDAGISAGNIESIALNIIEKNSSTSFNNFSIKIDYTMLDAFDIQQPHFEVNNGTSLYSADYITKNGWNEFVFDTPFEWDGNSNIMIQLCFDNNNFSTDDIVAASNVDAFRSQYKYIDGNMGCSLSSIPTVKMQRPNIRFKQSNIILSASEITSKTSPTIYPGSNNFYKDEHTIILTAEHNTPIESDCFKASLDQVGDGQESKFWLQNASVSEKQFYVESDVSFEGSLNLYFSAAELNNWANINDLHIIRTNGKISEQNNSIYDIIDNTNILISQIHDDLIAFSFYTNELGGFALTNYQANSVPVTIVEFDALRNGESNLLKWKVESEFNINHYVIERSFDGRFFEEIGAVSAINNVDQEDEYYFEDSDLFFSNKNYYYRLKTLENDGSSKYSDIVSVFVNKNSMAHIDAFPNPFGEKVNIVLNGTESKISIINITDIGGNQFIKKELSNSKSNIELNLDRLMPGVFIIDLFTTDGDHFTKTIIKR